MTLENWIDSTSASVERSLVMLAVRFGPLIAPVGPAYFVGLASMVHYGASLPVAVIIALSVEAVGIMTTHTAFQAWAWNRTRDNTDRNKKRTAPTWLAVLAALGYAATGMTLAIALDVAAGQSWAKAGAKSLLFLLAVAAYVALAVRHKVGLWESEQNQSKAEQRRSKDRTSEINTLTDRVQELEATEQLANDLTEQLKTAEQTANNLRAEQSKAERRAKEAEREATKQGALRQELAATLGKLIDGSDAEKIAVAHRMWPDLPQRSLAIIGGVSPTTANKIVNSNGANGAGEAAS